MQEKRRCSKLVTGLLKKETQKAKGDLFSVVETFNLRVSDTR